jgi:hypothetical protein
MTNYFRKPDALVDAVRSILSGQPTETQEDIQRKSDVKMVKVKLPDGHMVMRRDRPKIEIGKGKNESLDPVDQKALKGKHSDRKDKDIDNDGDVDSSDEYLHKRRKAVSKAMKEGVEDNPANTQHLCAKNVVHESWGEGSCIPTMHADPDEEGNVAWYDVMFDHGIEEQVSIEELKVTKAESHMHSSKKKIKESDDEDDEDDEDDDDDDSDEDEKNGKKKKVSGKKDAVDVEPEMDDTKMVTEKEMTPAQEKKREEIVLSMKKEMPRFKKKYGDRAKDVMYATATKMAMKEGFELGIEKSDLIEEVELDEAKIAKKVPAKDGGHFVVLHRDTSGMRGTQDKFHMRHLKNGKVKDYGTHPSLDGALKFAKNRGIIEDKYDSDKFFSGKGTPEQRTKLLKLQNKALRAFPSSPKQQAIKQEINALRKEMGMQVKEEVELDEAKSGTGYDLYHKDFSSAMQHAYDHAKKKHGITINPKEIDDKVATGPAKPKEGKTNSYRLKGDKGAIQVQVYNKGGSKPFELNMYKEETELDEGFINIGGAKVKDDEKSILQHIKKTFPNVKKVRKDPNHGWIPVFEEVELDEAKVTKKERDRLEDQNEHGLLALKLAKAYGTPAEVKKIEAINKKHQKDGSIERKDQQERDSISNKYYKMAEETELDEGRGRPRKDGTKSDTDDREHIQMQLRKSVSLRGLKDVEFDDGKKVKVPAKVAQGVMSKINSIKDAKQKHNAVQHIAKSHKHMMDFHKGDYKDADAKRQDILKLK